MAIGIAAAIGAAVCYGAAPAAQAVAARREQAGSGMGTRLALRLARNPLWLAGLAGELLGFVLEAYAFSAAPATLVAPMMACDTIVFVLIGSSLFAERLSPRGVAGICVISVGVAVLALVFAGNDQFGATATAADLLWFLGVAVVACLLAGLVGGRAIARGRVVAGAAVFSVAAGVSYAMATMGTRQVGRTFHVDRPWALLTTPTPYVLAGCGLLAVVVTQRGLQANALLTFPVVSAMSAMLPTGLAAGVLGDPVPHGVQLAGFVAALVLIAGGVALLGRDRAVAERRAAASRHVDVEAV